MIVLGGFVVFILVVLCYFWVSFHNFRHKQEEINSNFDMRLKVLGTMSELMKERDKL